MFFHNCIALLSLCIQSLHMCTCSWRLTIRNFSSLTSHNGPQKRLTSLRFVELEFCGNVLLANGFITRLSKCWIRTELFQDNACACNKLILVFKFTIVVLWNLPLLFVPSVFHDFCSDSTTDGIEHHDFHNLK